MANYDHDILGVGNPDHPANEKEYFDEKEITDNANAKLIEAIKSINKRINQIESEQGIWGSVGMSEELLEEYQQLKRSLTLKIDRL